MGMDFYVHVGVFVRVPGYAGTQVRSVSACTGCGNSKNLKAGDSFCPSCGQPVRHTEVERPAARVPSPYEVPGFSDELVTCDVAGKSDVERGYAIWIPNRKGFGHTLSDTHNCDDLEISADSAAQMVAAFIDQYKPLLTAAKQHFGVTPQVCYGVVPYHA